MRILVAHSFYKTFGGEDRYVGQQMKLLSPVHDVALLERSNVDLEGNAKTAARMTYSPRETNAVDRAIQEFRPDVVHLHNPYPALGPAVHLATARRRIPLVVTIHNFRLRCPNSLMFTEGSLCSRCEGGMYANAVRHRCFPSKEQAYGYAASLWIHRFILRLEKKVDLFVVPSRFMQKQLSDWGIARDRTSLVPNYTDVPLGSPSLGDFGLYFGRLSAEKGLDHLVTALKFAGDPPFRIVGDGPLEQKLKEMISALGLTNTHMTGRVPPEELPAVLQEARFVVLPSVSHENAPLAALEALAAARPLLVTDRGGLPELVEEGAGITCRASDAQDLADKIRTLFEDPDACLAAGARAVKRAEEEYGAGVHLARLERVYRLARAGSDPSRAHRERGRARPVP